MPRPERGHRTYGSIKGSAEGVVSDTSFVQLYGQTKRITRLWPSARLLTRLEYATTLIDELETLPPTVRFFAGGDLSVRGYAYKSLGPKDEFGEVVGGKHLLTGSVELDQRVAEQWSVAAFVDAGNAFDDYGNLDIVTGVGAGVRWYSLLGPIRIDIAVPLENDAPDNYRIHITVGPDL
jgi:translocation and assembly module TamA